MNLLPLLWGCYEPDDVLESEPAHEDGLAHGKDEMLLVLAFLALNKNLNPLLNFRLDHYTTVLSFK